MSLQYRMRDRSNDMDWEQRVRLSRCLIAETVDWWCRQDVDFPIAQTVAGLVYVFSPRCNPFRAPEIGIREHLLAIVDTPLTEYSKTRPQDPESNGLKLVEALCHVLETAVLQWNDGSMRTTAIDSVVQKLAEVIIEQQYVVVHHHQTTRRDLGGFYASG